MFSINDCIVVHGGQEEGFDSDVAIYSLKDKQWILTKLSDSPPLRFHTANVYKNSVLVYGGQGSNSQDVLEIDINKFKFEKKDNPVTSENKPDFLSQIPLGPLNHLLSWLDGESISQLTATNRILRQRCIESPVWRDLYFKLTGFHSEDNSSNWRSRYIQMQSAMNRSHLFPSTEIFLVNRDYYSVKIAVFGSGGVGKSATVLQFIQNKFVDDHDPTIEDSYRKQISLENSDKPVVLDVWDTVPYEDFPALGEQFIQRGQGFMLMYSITDRNSFDTLYRYYEHILRVKDTYSVPMVLIGNKADLGKDRVVTTEEATNLAQKWNIPFFEASAKIPVNNQEIFLKITTEIIMREDICDPVQRNRRKKCIVM